MKIAAITKFKNGALFVLLKKLGWTQSELARRTGIHPTWVGLYCNLKRKPTEEAAQKIQNAFGEAGEFLDVLEAWPAEFKPLKNSIIVEQVKDVELDALEYECHLNYLQEFNVEREEMDRTFRELLPVLNDQEMNVIESRYGLSGGQPETCESIGKRFHVTRSHINGIERKALRKLRRKYDFELRDHKRSLELARIKQYAESRPKVTVPIEVKVEKIAPVKKTVPKKKHKKRKYSQEWVDLNTEPKTPQDWVSMCETPFGFYIANLVKTVQRPTTLAPQIERGMLRSSFMRSSPGTFVKYADGETVIRTVYNRKDTSVYYLLVSRFPK